MWLEVAQGGTNLENGCSSSMTGPGGAKQLAGTTGSHEEVGGGVMWYDL